MQADFKRITLPTKEIPADEFAAVAKYFEKSRNYSYLEEGSPSWSIITEAAKLARNISTQQLLSIRNLVLKNKIIQRNAAVRAAIHRYADMYGQGMSILQISEDADYPPVHLLRMIILHRGESPRDKEQGELAQANDINSAECEVKTAKFAEEAEHYFITKLRELGMSLRDQNQLIEEQRGSALKLTPDGLLDEPVYINGHLVHWVDFKNYVGAPIGFTRKSNTRQAAKYTEAFGAGAICYGKSVVAGYSIAGTYLLDVSSIMDRRNIDAHEKIKIAAQS